MKDIVEIQEKLRDTSQMLAKLTVVAQNFPGSDPFLQEFKSLEKRKRQLEKELREAALAMGREVCSYRIISEGDNERLPAAGLSGAIGNFQDLFSIVYDSLGKRRNTAKITSETTRKTELDFAYAMAGSAVFVFTVPMNSDLFGNSEVDTAVQKLFEAANAVRSGEIRTFARNLGKAPIRALYKWANINSKFSLGAEVQWWHGEEILHKLDIDKKQFEHLVDVIAETSDKVQTESDLSGKLVGADVSTRTFHFEPDIGDDIRGYFGQAIGTSNPVALPGRYRVLIKKTVTVLYATEEEKTSYELLNLTPLFSNSLPGTE